MAAVGRGRVYLHSPLPRTFCGELHLHAGGMPQGALVGHAGTGVGVGVGVGVTVGAGVGLGVGVADGVGVGVGVDGVGVAVGVGVGVGVGVPVGVPTGVPVGVGDGPEPLPVETKSCGLILRLAACVDTVGSSKVGIPDPPFNIATVPEGDTKITLEFSALAVPTVQAPLQK